MKAMICKMRNCPRLVTASTLKGEKPFAQCNQQMPDEAPYWIDCEDVSKEWCKVLREELHRRKEVQV